MVTKTASSSQIGPKKFGVSSTATAKPSAEIAKMEAKVADLEKNNGILEKEREFYFSKLSLIEELISKHGFEKSPMGEGMLKVLYAGETE